MILHTTYYTNYFRRPVFIHYAKSLTSIGIASFIPMLLPVMEKYMTSLPERQRLSYRCATQRRHVMITRGAAFPIIHSMDCAGMQSGSAGDNMNFYSKNFLGKYERNLEDPSLNNEYVNSFFQLRHKTIEECFIAWIILFYSESVSLLEHVSTIFWWHANCLYCCFFGEGCSRVNGNTLDHERQASHVRKKISHAVGGQNWRPQILMNRQFCGKPHQTWIIYLQ